MTIKPNYIDTNTLTNLLDDCKADKRNGFIFLNLDNDDFMFDVSLEIKNKKNFDCHVWGAENEFILMDFQKELIKNEAIHSIDKVKEDQF